MRILFVAMSDSIHTSRWINQFVDQNWELHLFPSQDSGVSHPNFNNVCIHHSIYGRQAPGDRNNRIRGVPVIDNKFAYVFRGLLKTVFPRYRINHLSRLIKKIRPDIVHSMEIQSAGYLTMEAYRISRPPLPPWIVSNWGSDIYLFGKLDRHSNRIKEVMQTCDFYACECRRDIQLARQFGFKGKNFPVLPNSGGLDFDSFFKLKQNGKTSERRRIILKGYQSWAGRALVALRALERCADCLKGYEIVIYSATEDVLIAAELFKIRTGIPVCIIPLFASHEEILKSMGQARIYLGLSISDALSTSAIEAMSMGAFPIQSDTSCIDEWIEDGKTGLIVPPNDPDVIEKALRSALTDDNLVDKAADENIRMLEEHFDHRDVKAKAIQMYAKIIKEKECRH